MPAVAALIVWGRVKKYNRVFLAHRRAIFCRKNSLNECKSFISKIFCVLLALCTVSAVSPVPAAMPRGVRSLPLPVLLFLQQKPLFLQQKPLFLLQKKSRFLLSYSRNNLYFSWNNPCFSQINYSFSRIYS